MEKIKLKLVVNNKKQKKIITLEKYDRIVEIIKILNAKNLFKL